MISLRAVVHNEGTSVDTSGWVACRHTAQQWVGMFGSGFATIYAVRLQNLHRRQERR